jgi:hypothetical protein
MDAKIIFEISSIMQNSKLSFLVLVAIIALTGCARKQPLYQWGSYEDQVYALYSDAGKVPIEAQLQSLERDYQVARSANRPLPPGYHAHMGYLYFQLGKIDQAYQSFVTEEALFPESKIYMDRLIARMKKE